MRQSQGDQQVKRIDRGSDRKKVFVYAIRGAIILCVVGFLVPWIGVGLDAGPAFLMFCLGLILGAMGILLAIVSCAIAAFADLWSG